MGLYQKLFLYSSALALLAQCEVDITQDKKTPVLDYRAAFQKELDEYLVKLQQPSATNGKRDPKKLAQLKGFGEEFLEGICKRFATDISDSAMNEVTFQPGFGGIDALKCVHDDTSLSAKRARLEELRTELKRKSDEEEQLRSEYRDLMKAQNDERWRCGDMELENARKGALTSASQIEDLSGAAEKAALLKSSLEQFEAQMSTADSVVAKLEEDAKNLRSIEEQNSRPGLAIEELWRGPSTKDPLPGEQISRMEDANDRLKQEFEIGGL